MTENTNEPTIISHRDAKLADLREDLTKAQAKVAKIEGQIEALERAAENEAAIEAIEAGSEVAYVYGRALNKRVLNGTVRATARNDKGVLQMKVEYGSGFDSEFHLIDSSALLFSPAEIDAAQAEIDAAKAEAAKAAAEAAKDGAA